MSSRLLRSALFLVGIFVFGTVGYRVIEAAGWWESFYMTAITLTTVGYREVFPLSRAGEVFTVVLVLSGLGLILLVVTEAARVAVEGELRSILGQVRRSRMIERLSGHEIVCGWGRMGQAVVGELRRTGHKVVVIEHSAEKVRLLQEDAIPVLVGDATAEATLKSAGVSRARGLVACLNDDANNVYTVLTARSLNPELFIVSRCGGEGAEERVLRAGANRAVNPYHLGGIRLAHILTKPTVVDFLEFSLGPAGRELRLEQVIVAPASPLAGRTLAELELRRRTGVAVAAVHRGENLFPNPEPNLRIEIGDTLVVLGTRSQLESFETAIVARNRPEEV